MTQFPIQNGSLSQKEINSEFYFVDIVFLLAGYKVIPGLFSSFLLRDGHIVFEDRYLQEKGFVIGSEADTQRAKLLSLLYRMSPFSGFEPDINTLRIKKKVAYILFCKTNEIETESINRFFSNFPDKNSFYKCHVTDSEVDNFLLGQSPFRVQDTRKRERIEHTDSTVIFESTSDTDQVTVAFIKDLAKEAPQFETILRALAQWSKNRNKQLVDLEEILNKQFNGWWVERKENQSCSQTQLTAIEKIFMKPPQKGRGKKKPYGKWSFEIKSDKNHL